MNLLEQLKRDEGVKLHAYRDSLGLWTIGVGHLIDPSKGAHPPPEMTMPHGVIDEHCTITQTVCDRLLQSDIHAAEHELASHLPWTASLDEVRRGVLINMTFNLGINGLMAFKNTLAMIEGHKWDVAARAMLQSKWALQVHARADRLAEQMRTGAWV